MISKNKDSGQRDKKGRGDNGKDGYGSEKPFEWYVGTGDPIGVDEANNSSKKSHQGSHGQTVN